jgi:hypothetical protein
MQTKIFKFVHSVGVFSHDYDATMQLSVHKPFEYCPWPQICGHNKTEINVEEGRTSVSKQPMTSQLLVFVA